MTISVPALGQTVPVKQSGTYAVTLARRAEPVAASGGCLRSWLARSARALPLWLLAVWPPPVWYRTHWPSKTEFMRMRRRASDDARPAYRPVPLDSIAPAMIAGGGHGRGRPVLDPRRDRLARGAEGAGLSARRVRLGLGAGPRRSCGGRWDSVRPAGGAPRGEHDHPAARQESLSLAVAQSAPEAQGGGDGLPAGARAGQAADPRALSQRRGAGRRGLGGGGGEPAVLPDVGPAGSPRPRPRRSRPPCRFR